MENIPRYLITTADESTWKFDRPVIFLGEWCRLYERRHVWEDMDAIVATPYGLGQFRKDVDHEVARSLEDKLFPKLCAVLNKHHDVKYSERFWKIVLGHWFRRYVDVLLNRINTLKHVLDTYIISGTTVYSDQHYMLATPDSYSAVYSFNDNYWNSVLTGRILDTMNPVSIRNNIESITGCSVPYFSFEELRTAPTFVRSIFKWAFKTIRSATAWFALDSDSFIINSYLPKKEEILMQLMLRQIPQLWSSPVIKISEKPEPELRKYLASRMKINSSDDLEKIISLMIFELIPVVYLEGFESVNNITCKIRWPDKPKFIFTSNNFDYDEVFKLWAAKKSEIGSKYIVGQHGNNPAIHRYIINTVDQTTSDKYITWGWRDGRLNYVPGFIFKTIKMNSKYYNSQSGLLLIELNLNHRITTWDSYAEFVDYFEEQQRFVAGLSILPRKELTIRLHSGCKYQEWSEEKRWEMFDPLLKLDGGSGDIQDALLKNKLVVHSYDSTGMLETLSRNIPTLAFWQNGLDHLRDSAKPYYQLLIDAGIVHLTPESIADKVNTVWDDVDTWWNQYDVQNARSIFCNRYAKVSQTPIQDIVSILKD